MDALLARPMYYVVSGLSAYMLREIEINISDKQHALGHDQGSFPKKEVWER